MLRLRKLAASFAAVLLALSVAWTDDGPEHRAEQPLPIKMGTSGINANDPRVVTGFDVPCVAATLGSAVTCNGVLHVLSNNHVLACYGPPVGEDVIQPGLADLSPPCVQTPVNSNVVADFVGDIVPLGTRALSSSVDAAIAVAQPGAVDPSGEILDVGVPCAAPKHWHPGMAVAKSGRTTGLTTGTVFAGFFDVRVNNAPELCGIDPFIMKNQFAVTSGDLEIVRVGDSGSLIVTHDADRRPVGLLWGGGRIIAFGTPIGSVIEAFEPFCGGRGGFRFVGRECSDSESTETAVLSPSAMEIEYARQVKERHVDRLMSMRGVLGVGVGASERDPGKAAIVVLVETGRRYRRWIPSELEGVEVRVLLSDKIRAL